MSNIIILENISIYHRIVINNRVFMKKILFILPLIVLSACSSTPSDKDCPPEQNYIKSNPEAMDKYKEEFKNGDIEGLFYKFDLKSFSRSMPCKRSNCIYFNPKKYKFAEFKFNDSLRNGIYTSYWSANKKDEKCKETPAYQYSGPAGCYYLIKNDNNTIKSKYGIYIRNQNEATITKFYKINDNSILYEESSTIYTTGAIGGPGYGSCGIKKENINNINYKFNPISFPYDPLKVFN